MDATHLRHHIDDLRGRSRFLRTLKPDGDRYKLWLGDLVEFLNVAYGPDAPEMARVREALIGRQAADSAEEAGRERAYLARIDALVAVLDDLERRAGDPISFFDTR